MPHLNNNRTKTPSTTGWGNMTGCSKRMWAYISQDKKIAHQQKGKAFIIQLTIDVLKRKPRQKSLQTLFKHQTIDDFKYRIQINNMKEMDKKWFK